MMDSDSVISRFESLQPCYETSKRNLRGFLRLENYLIIVQFRNICTKHNAYHSDRRTIFCAKFTTANLSNNF